MHYGETKRVLRLMTERLGLLNAEGRGSGKVVYQFSALNPIHESDSFRMAVTVPNSVLAAMRNLCKALPTDSAVTNPQLYFEQRHFKSQRSKGTNDGRLQLIQSTVIPVKQDGIKCQPQWAEAASACW